jgi:hypothetical protein
MSMSAQRREGALPMLRGVHDPLRSLVDPPMRLATALIDAAPRLAASTAKAEIDRL